MKRFGLWLAWIGLAFPLLAQESPWLEIAEEDVPRTGQRSITPRAYRVFRLDVAALETLLAGAPHEGQGGDWIVELPLPDGELAAFYIENSPVMAPELSARYPDIQTFLGKRVDLRGAILRADITPAGFHAMILAPGATYFIDPYQNGDRRHYLVYEKDDYQPSVEKSFSCEAEILNQILGRRPLEIDPNARVPIEGELLTYRAAIAATGEYTAFHGGTVPLGLAAVVTTLNRVNGIYERELAIRMELVANNDLLIYTNAGNDPYSNFDGFTMLSQNQANLDAVVGSANYDVGHVFSTGGGGIAALGVICLANFKAQGVTGLSQPIGDPFDVDFVAHEMGHQFGANHSFNGTTSNCCCGNRNGGTAYEPGSGSTIMAYAGICGAENLQNNSDDYFHGTSYDQIVAYTRSGGGNTCPTVTVVNNSAPAVEAGPAFNIPAQTPFMLTGMATDPDVDEGGDILTYAWEQFDLGASSPPNTDNGNRPIFRSFDPVTNPARTFPQLTDILNQTTTFGESLPTTTRTLTFRLTVRDNHPGGGGVDFDTVQLNVNAGAGPFLITSPNTAVTWMGGDMETVTWDVANTDQNPIDCALVDILLSTDGGLTFDTVVAQGLTNNGSAVIQVPNVDTLQARLKVICADNIFFDISNADFTIEAVALLCNTAFENWRESTVGQFIDVNGNELVDVADLVFCLFP